MLNSEFVRSPPGYSEDCAPLPGPLCIRPAAQLRELHRLYDAASQSSYLYYSGLTSTLTNHLAVRTKPTDSPVLEIRVMTNMCVAEGIYMWANCVTHSDPHFLYDTRTKTRRPCSTRRRGAQLGSSRSRKRTDTKPHTINTGNQGQARGYLAQDSRGRVLWRLDRTSIRVNPWGQASVLRLQHGRCTCNLRWAS